MVRVRYTGASGPGYSRVLEQGTAGLKHSYVWSEHNNFTVEMTNKESESLLAEVPGEFEAVDSDDEPDATAKKSSKKEPEDAVIVSENDGTDPMSVIPESDTSGS
jgi:hypothetical protein